MAEPEYTVEARAACERCDQPIIKVNGYWTHDKGGALTPCPRACPPEEEFDAVHDNLRNLFGPKIGDEIVFGGPSPRLVAQVDQAWAASRANRADGPQAAAEGRCAAPPVGCGQPLGKPLSVAFRDQRSRREYDITHLCQPCQDLLFAPPPDEVLEMAADPEHYERCSECGNWVALESVDVGVGVIRGHDCCADVRHYGATRAPRCARTEDCPFEDGHFFNCENRATFEEDLRDPDAGLRRLQAWMVENGVLAADSSLVDKLIAKRLEHETRLAEFQARFRKPESPGA